MHGIALHSVIPVRAEAREQAEQTTQMLFGEVCTIEEVQGKNKKKDEGGKSLAQSTDEGKKSLAQSADEGKKNLAQSTVEGQECLVQNTGKAQECIEENACEEQKNRWNRVKLQLDGQEGWVDKKMITPMSPEEYKAHTQALKTAAMVVMPMAYAVSENNGQTIPLTAGTRLPNYKEGAFSVLGVRFRIDPSMVIEHPLELTQANLLQATRFFLNVPYLWGGKNALGMDCSGFTQIVFSLFGKQLQRDASAQVRQGRAIAGLKTAKPGDLVFLGPFNEENEVKNEPNGSGECTIGPNESEKCTTESNGPEKCAENSTAEMQKESKPTENERVTHVGILLDQERVLHCSGRVKVERIDNTGILSMEQADEAHPTGVYTHKLLYIKRV